MQVLMVLPTMGRIERTLDLLRRLKATAGYPFTLAVVLSDPGESEAIRCAAPWAFRVLLDHYRGYWDAMRAGCAGRKFDAVGNLGNDVLPGHDWLIRACRVFAAQFPDGLGLVGWNDGIKCGPGGGHFLAGRLLLEEYYGADLWPVCYRHYYGDTEIWDRALAQRRAGTALKAVLFHNHPLIAGQHDTMYDAAMESEAADRAVYMSRRDAIARAA